MSTLRRLVVTADPALLVTDAPPAGVPDDADAGRLPGKTVLLPVGP